MIDLPFVSECHIDRSVQRVLEKKFIDQSLIGHRDQLYCKVVCGDGQ